MHRYFLVLFIALIGLASCNEKGIYHYYGARPFFIQSLWLI